MSGQRGLNFEILQFSTIFQTVKKHVHIHTQLLSCAILMCVRSCVGGCALAHLCVLTLFSVAKNKKPGSCAGSCWQCIWVGGCVCVCMHAVYVCVHMHVHMSVHIHACVDACVHVFLLHHTYLQQYKWIVETVLMSMSTWRAKSDSMSIPHICSLHFPQRMEKGWEMKMRGRQCGEGGEAWGKYIYI